MKLKGRDSISYTISGKEGTIEVVVELKQVEGLVKLKQNLYEGFARMNGDKTNHFNLQNCVNAQYMAEHIVEKKMKELREKHGRKLRIKKKKS